MGCSRLASVFDYSFGGDLTVVGLPEGLEVLRRQLETLAESALETVTPLQEDIEQALWVFNHLYPDVLELQAEYNNLKQRHDQLMAQFQSVVASLDG